MMNLSERLIQLKTERNILQKDIAKDNNISLRAYQYYEQGVRNPTSDIVIKLADYFDVSTDYLLGRTDNPNSHKPLPQQKKGGDTMSTTGEKPGKGVYTCTKCGQKVVLDDKTDTLPPCPKCHATTYRP